MYCCRLRPLSPFSITRCDSWYLLCHSTEESVQGWKISWYFQKYRKCPIFWIFSVYKSSICTYIAKIIWNLLPNSMCVCALHIMWSTLVNHTSLLWRGAIWQKLSNTEKMLRAHVISQQNTQTEKQNVVTMCHIKSYFQIIDENWKYPIRYFWTKISDIYLIYQWYISAIYIKPTLILWPTNITCITTVIL